jgi:hypothetical protein
MPVNSANTAFFPAWIASSVVTSWVHAFAASTAFSRPSSSARAWFSAALVATSNDDRANPAMRCAAVAVSAESRANCSANWALTSAASRCASRSWT